MHTGPKFHVLGNDKNTTIVPRRIRQLPNYEFAVRFAGAGLSNMFSSAMTNPVRQQLQNDRSTSRSFFNVAKGMIGSEGAFSLMNGVSASVLREGIYATIRLGTYEAHKDLLYELSNGALTREGIPLKALSGLMSGAIGASIANPTDLIKIRMQAYHNPPVPAYSSVLSSLRCVYNEGGGTLSGGLRSLWRGTTATVTRGAIITVAQIGSYDHFKQVFKSHRIMDEGMPLHLTSSLFAGRFSPQVIQSNVDVIKVRMMNDHERMYRGVSDCIIKTLRKEDPRLNLYQGFGMCWIRLGSHTTLTLLLYEQLRAWAGVRPL
ncbi:mitochondrial carrier domain-containing protein [Rhizoctonia solani]|nr:mitochondrial carrier domain-containing protein [Rhizoctonia solani]